MENERQPSETIFLITDEGSSLKNAARGLPMAFYHALLALGAAVGSPKLSLEGWNVHVLSFSVDFRLKGAYVHGSKAKQAADLFGNANACRVSVFAERIVNGLPESHRAIIETVTLS